MFFGAQGPAGVLAEEVLGLPAQQRGRGRIDEGDPEVAVDPEDPLAHRVQDALVTCGELHEVLGAARHPLLELRVELLVVDGAGELAR